MKKFGQPPWELIRNIFIGFGLSFDINDPIEDSVDIADGVFSLVFKHTGKGNKHIPFLDLSSGEKILLTLINAIYTANQNEGLPKLILLDEIDSPLNPSIVENFVSYLRDNFVMNDVKIILTTHSPTTVAFAPAGSVYVINTNNINPITQVDSREAINMLSEGFITLSNLLELETMVGTHILISEGNNYRYLKQAKSFYAAPLTDIEIVDFSIGGTGQLRALFDFIRKFNSTKKFVFIFDTDYRLKVKLDSDGNEVVGADGEPVLTARDFTSMKTSAEENNRFFVFNPNSDSDSLKGIENLFTKSTSSDYKKIIKGEFDKKGPKNKKGFEKYILNRNKKLDFKNFKPLFDFIKGSKIHNL